MTIDINDIDPKRLNDDERIDAYLKGSMSKEEEQQFIKDIEADPELKSKAIAMARLVKGLKQVGTRQDKEVLDAFLAATENEVNEASRAATKQRKAKIFSLRKVAAILSIAACLTCVVWLGLEYNDYRYTTSLGEKYGETFSSGMLVRGADSPTDAEKKLESLFADVKSGDNLDEAIHELSLCWELSTMDTYNDYTGYSAEIGWNLAIAYLKDNDKDGAKKVLEELIENTEECSAIHTKAKELLSKTK